MNYKFILLKVFSHRGLLTYHRVHFESSSLQPSAIRSGGGRAIEFVPAGGGLYLGATTHVGGDGTNEMDERLGTATYEHSE
jgi:hypothetical protein